MQFGVSDSTTDNKYVIKWTLNKYGSEALQPISFMLIQQRTIWNRLHINILFKNDSINSKVAIKYLCSKPFLLFSFNCNLFNMNFLNLHTSPKPENLQARLLRGETYLMLSRITLFLLGHVFTMDESFRDCNRV